MIERKRNKKEKILITNAFIACDYRPKTDEGKINKKKHAKFEKYLSNVPKISDMLWKRLKKKM